MNIKAKRIAFVGVMASLALVLAYVEFLIPPLFSAFPGIKMGLPNIVIIFTLYKLGTKEAVCVSFIRLVCSALLFGSILTFAYSLAGAVLSLTLMALLKRFNSFSPVGVSVVGGICHNIGQTLVAICLLGRIEIGYYLAVLLISGTVAGALVGLAGSLLLKLMKNIKI